MGGTGSAARDRRRALWAAVLLAAIVMAAGAYRSTLLGPDAHPVHVDEGYSYLSAVGFLEHGCSCFIDTGEPYRRAVLHQYLVSRAMLVFGTSIHVARGVSLLFSLITLIAVYHLCRFWSGRAASLIAAAVIAFAWWENYYATNARMYAPFQAACIVSLVAAISVLRRPGHIARWAGLAVSLFTAAGIHRLVIIFAASVLAPLFAGLVRRVHAIALLVAFALMIAAVYAGLRIESMAPEPTMLREILGPHAMEKGTILKNLNIQGLKSLDGRMPVVVWLGMLSLPLAVVRRNQAMAMAWFAATGIVMGATVGIVSTADRYIFHAFPIAVALGVGVLEVLVLDARARRNTLAETLAGLGELAGEWSRRFGFPPAARIVSIVAGLGLVAFGALHDLAVDSLVRFGPAQALVMAAGAALIFAPWVSRAAAALGERANVGLLAVLAVLFVALVVPSWRLVVPHPYAPYQHDAMRGVQEYLRPGDRLLTTAHTAADVHLHWRPAGFVSQKLRDGRLTTYRTDIDASTGMAFVDEPRVLEEWLTAPGRCVVLVDRRIFDHVGEEMRERIFGLPLLFEIDHRGDPGRYDNSWLPDSFFRAFLVDNGDGDAPSRSSDSAD